MSNPLLHEINVNGRKFLASFHYFAKIQPNQLSIPNISDYSSKIYEKYAIHAIFLNGNMMLTEKNFLLGLFHALKDQYNHEIHASPVFAIDVLMHVYCTNQINNLKERLIPRSFHEAAGDDNPMVMILVGEDSSKENFERILDQIHEDFIITTLDIEPENFTSTDRNMTQVLDSIGLRIVQDGNQGNGNVQGARILQSKMALFSLNLQLKR